MIDIFNKRWHGIQAQHIGEGKYAMDVIQIQTSDKGPWQALTASEVAMLLAEHNKIIHNNEKPRFDVAAQVKALGADSLLPPSKKKAKKKGKRNDTL
jgi:hypothetical protein